MRPIAKLIPLLALAACAKAEKPAPDAPAAAAPTVSLQDLAGTWNMQTFRAGSDSVLVSYQLVATGTESGWSINFPGRDPVPLRVLAVAGDSVMSEAGPYESAVRSGVQVTTRSVMRRSGDKLVGTTVATYSDGQELQLRTEGTR
jgi:hypothetical protein